MRSSHAVILHRHVLFRDLMAQELRDLGLTGIAGATNDPEVAIDLLVKHQAGALVVEYIDGFMDRPAILQLFCRAATVAPELVLIAANLATSEIEVLQDSVAHGAHLAGLKPILHGAAS
jgi:hypothetical protein